MAKKKATASPELSFEEAMQDLEAIVRRLEHGGGDLEEALQEYSRAIELMKICHTQLDGAERRIEVLSGVDAEGNPITKPLEERKETLKEKQARRSTRRSANHEDTDSGDLF